MQQQNKSCVFIPVEQSTEQSTDTPNYNHRALAHKTHLMKKQLIVLVAFLFAGIQLFAQESKTFEISSFSQLSVAVPASITLKQGAAALKVSGDADLVAALIVKQEANVLKLKFPNHFRSQHSRLTIEISMPTVSVIDLAGSVSLQNEGSISTESLKIDMAGSCKLNLSQLSANTLNIDGSGSCNVVLSGRETAAKLDVDISGSGTVSAENFCVQHADVDVSGSGNIRLYATQSLDVDLSGSAKVAYKGSPAIRSDMSGSCKLFRIE